MRRLTKARPKSMQRVARDFDAQMRRYERDLEQAYMAAAAVTREAVPFAALVQALRSGDDREAEELMRRADLAEALVGGSSERSFRDRMVEAFEEGGVLGAKQLPPDAARAITSLDLTNPEAVKYIQDNLPEKIKGISDESREAVRQAIERGIVEGRPAAKMARDIREVVGLTPQQAEAVLNLRDQLESGVAGATTPPGSRRLSAVEQRQAEAIMEAGGGSGDRVDALVSRYAQSLTNLRAKTIARTETHDALIQGELSLWSQAIDQGLVSPDTARKFWIVSADERLRDDHRAVPEMNPYGVPIDQPFDTPVEAVMAPGMSGVAAFDVACRCAVFMAFAEAPMVWDPEEESYSYAQAAA